MKLLKILLMLLIVIVEITPANIGAEEIQSAEIVGVERIEIKMDEMFLDGQPKDLIFSGTIMPYVLGPGDVVEVSIYSYPDSSSNILVDSQGNISYMFADRMNVAGKTILQVKERLTMEIAKELRDPIVSVIPIEFNSTSITVVGAVKFPGSYSTNGTQRVLDAIAMASGLEQGRYRGVSVELADLEHTFLIRGGDYLPIDFVKLVNSGDLSQNELLKAGDYIYVATALNNEVIILGDIKNPGSYGFVNSLGVLQLLSRAGGYLQTARNQIIVIRGSLSEPVVYRIDVGKIIQGEQTDFMLKPKDIVYVPRKPWLPIQEVVEMGIEAFIKTTANTYGKKFVDQNIGVREDSTEKQIVPIF